MRGCRARSSLPLELRNSGPPHAWDAGPGCLPFNPTGSDVESMVLTPLSRVPLLSRDLAVPRSRSLSVPRLPAGRASAAGETARGLAGESSQRWRAAPAHWQGAKANSSLFEHGDTSLA